jgi:hypothetical protein
MSTMRPIRVIATALLVGSVAVAGCARSQPDPSATPDRQQPAITAPPTTKAPAPAPAGGTASSRPAVLPDGRHPVMLKTVDPDRRTITFDLIQWYVGEEAVREAAKDHKESPPPNDHYIRNVNPRLRTLPVRSDAIITCNTLTAGYTGSATKDVRVPLDRLAIVLPPGGAGPFWITVDHDQVVRIAQQYIP